MVHGGILKNLISPFFSNSLSEEHNNMTYNFTFTTRDEYLAYRAEWRAKYREVTLEIRANKQEQRDNRGGDNADLQAALYRLRVRANKMMSERTAATEFKNNQLAALAAAAA
jgi:hypothetical protein